MYTPVKRTLFRRLRRHSNPYRVMVLIGLILIGLMINRGFEEGAFTSPYAPTPTPTRTTNSYEMEADTWFRLGKLSCARDSEDCAIAAYQKATIQDPNNAELWAQLARVQTYSSSVLTTNEDKLKRLKEALASIDKAVNLAPDDSTVHATRAFVLDWLASNALVAKDEMEARLTEAQNEANIALSLDPTNVSALAFSAEILIDQQKWDQAQGAINQALERDPNSVDVRRAHALVLENMGEYEQAIEEYKKTVEMAPNLSYLYINIGYLLRNSAQNALLEDNDKPKSDQLFQEALDYFAKAADLNTQLQIQDPIPYLAIAKTYSQMGETLMAVLNVRSALDINPTSAEVYAQLGMVYRSSRNFEGAIDAFRCAIDGCDATFSCKVRGCDPEKDEMVAISPIQLVDNTLTYYYSYGSTLAALSKPGINNNCQRATAIFSQIRKNGYASGEYSYVDGIIKPGEAICSSDSQNTSATPTPVATPVGLKPTATP